MSCQRCAFRTLEGGEVGHLMLQGFGKTADRGPPREWGAGYRARLAVGFWEAPYQAGVTAAHANAKFARGTGVDRKFSPGLIAVRLPGNISTRARN